jgi:hypothetical protein
MTASPQKNPGRFLAFIMLRAVATTIWFRRSTMPFFCGEYGAVNCRYTPIAAQCLVKSAEMNSPP